MRPLVIYHHPCDDGFGAALCAWRRFGDDGAEYKPINYTGINTWASFEEQVGEVQGRDVYILDFAFAPSITNMLRLKCRSLVWLDHHETAFLKYVGVPANQCRCPNTGELETYSEVTQYCTIRLDNNASGAMLAHRHFFPEEEPPIFIRHLDDRDRWQFKIPGTKDFTYALRTEPMDFHRWKSLLSTLTEGSPEYAAFIDKGAAIGRFFQGQLDMVQTLGEAPITIDTNIGSFTGLACNANSCFASELGERLAEKSGTFGMTYYIVSADEVRCSLRSRGDFSVEPIARALGGGGHKGAAGFKTDINTVMMWQGRNQ